MSTHEQQAREMLQSMAGRQTVRVGDFECVIDGREGVFDIDQLAALLAERDAQAQAVERMRAALVELVTLNRMLAPLDETREAGGLVVCALSLAEADAMRAEYARRKPAAWAAAFAIVDALAASPAAQEAQEESRRDMLAYAVNRGRMAPAAAKEAPREANRG